MTNETQAEPEYISRREAAELTGRDMRTIDRWANQGRLTRYKRGGLQWVVFSRAEVLRMVEPQAQDSPDDAAGE